MKNSMFIGAGVALFAFWYFNRQGSSSLDVIPINQTPQQQQVLNALLPTVDSNGDIVNPVNENVVSPYMGS